MFSIFSKKPSALHPQQRIFFVNAHLGRGTSEDMPQHLAGAYVRIYVCADDANSALREAFTQATNRGYDFLAISDGNKVHQMDPLEWDTYVNSAWPEFVSHFPKQYDVLKCLAPGWVFFGPFISYEPQNT